MSVFSNITSRLKSTVSSLRRTDVIPPRVIIDNPTSDEIAKYESTFPSDLRPLDSRYLTLNSNIPNGMNEPLNSTYNSSRLNESSSSSSPVWPITESSPSNTSSVTRFFPQYVWKGTISHSDGTIEKDGSYTVAKDLTDPIFARNPVSNDRPISRSEQDNARRKEVSLAQLYASLGSTISSKREYIDKVDSIRNYSLAAGIVNKVADDVMSKYNDKTLYPRFFDIRVNTDDELREIISPDLINRFLDKFNLEVFLKDYMEDLCWYGEYTFKIDWPNLELDDIDDGLNKIAVFSRSRFKYIVDIEKDDGDITRPLGNGYTDYDRSINSASSTPSNAIETLDKSQSAMVGSKVSLVPSRDYMVFRVGSSNVDLKIKDNTGAKLFTKLPEGIFSTTAINLMNTLQLLEELIPLGEITAVTNKSMFYLRMPIGTTMEQAYSNARKFETILIGLSRYEETPKDFKDLLSNSSKVKVIPLIGEQSQLESGNMEKREKVDLTFINDIRAQLANATSLPKKFFISDADDTTDTAYLKLLSNIRENISISVKHLVYNYINKILIPVAYKNGEIPNDLLNVRINEDNSHSLELPMINYDDLEVITPKVLGVDELDAVEYTNLFSQTLKDINDMISSSQQTIEQANALVVNKPVLIDFLNKKLAPLIGENIFLDYKEEADQNKDNDNPDNMNDTGFTPSNDTGMSDMNNPEGDTNEPNDNNPNNSNDGNDTTANTSELGDEVPSQPSNNNIPTDTGRLTPDVMK